MCNLISRYMRWMVMMVFVTACIPVLADMQLSSAIFVQKQLAALESSAHGRIGISAINTANNMRIQYRADERFPMCSTSKLIVVGAILKKSMTDPYLLQEKIHYKKSDIASYSPITKKYLAQGMTISQLCAAAISYSDNTAMNLLIKKLGGLQAVNAFARSIGDNTFRLDRLEPALNTAIPSDPRDTTTSTAMERTLQKLALGNVLAAYQQKLLQTWLKENTTGDTRIRAGVPKGWTVGDKTGIGEYGTTNDIGIIWPPKCPSIIIITYFTQTKKDADRRDDVIAAATRILLNAFARNDQCIKL